MSAYFGDFTPGKTIYVPFNTSDKTTPGAPITLAGTPAVSVYKRGSTIEATTGVTLTVDYDGRTGYHVVAIDTSLDGVFYAAANDFDVVITTGTVDGVSVVGRRVGTFSLSNRSALRPTTADRTLDVDAAGLADANVVKIGPSGSGTAQTARDIGTSVLLSSGTGMGQLDFTAGVVKANFVQILGTAITGTAAQLAAAITKFFNVSSPTGTVNSLPDAVAGATGGLAIVGSAMTLASSAVQAIWDAATSALTTAGSIGKMLVDKLNGVSGQVAAQSEVTGIQNNTRTVIAVPEVIERPDSGTDTYLIHLYLYDEVGNMEAPDSAPTVTLANSAGTDRSARLGSTTGTLVNTGHYKWVYTNTSTDTLEQLLWEFSVVEGGATRLFGRQTLLVDTSAVDFTSSDRTTLNGVASTLGAPANLGSGATVAGNLSDVNSTATSARNSAAAAEAVVTSATFGNSALKTLIDALDDYVDTEVAAIKAKTDQLTFTNSGKVDASLQAAADLVAAVANKIADHVRRRTQANVEASTDGDGLSLGSLYGLVQQAQESAVSGATLTVYKTDGTTSLGTKSLVSDSAAEPITGIS